MSLSMKLTNPVCSQSVSLCISSCDMVNMFRLQTYSFISVILYLMFTSVLIVRVSSIQKRILALKSERYYIFNNILKILSLNVWFRYLGGISFDILYKIYHPYMCILVRSEFYELQGLRPRDKHFWSAKVFNELIWYLTKSKCSIGGKTPRLSSWNNPK